jgi:hypothetical protein
MTTLPFYLVVHLVGFTMMAGAVLADFSINARLNKYLFTDKGRALVLLEGSLGLPRLIGFGAALLVLTGTAMTILLKDAVLQTIWFRIKMPLVLLIILDGVALARPNALKLRRLLIEDNLAGNIRIGRIRNRLRAIYILQLVLFAIVFVLSIFKF